MSGYEFDIKSGKWNFTFMKLFKRKVWASLPIMDRVAQYVSF